jgi:hypothetical protein
MCSHREVGMDYRDWDSKDKVGSPGGFFSSMFLVGAATGLIAGLLFAPQTGKKIREMFKERLSSHRDASMGRESMHEGWTGGTNDGATEESLEGTVHADYLH